MTKTTITTELTNKQVTTLYNMVNQQITVLQMTDDKHYEGESYRNLLSILSELADLNMQINNK